MNPGQQELSDYIIQIVHRTEQGEIVWSQAAPTAFISTRDTPSGPKKMVIQRASSGRRPEPNFLFQVKAIKRDEGGELAIDTSEKPYLRDVFSILYDAAESSVDSQTTRILRELLDE